MGGWASERTFGPPIPIELDRILRRMRLPYLRKAAPDVLATARAQRWDPAKVLRVLLHEEVIGRDAATRRMRRKAASFPTGKPFSSWCPEESSIPQPTQQALMTLEWIGRAENLAVAGPSGTGESHFIEALAHAAIEADLRVAWFTLETLTNTIGRAKVDGSIARTVARICRCDLTVVEDIGMLPAGQDAAAEAFYRVVDAAYERRSVAITSNLHPRASTRSCPRPGDRHGGPAAAPRPPGLHGRNAKLIFSVTVGLGARSAGIYSRLEVRRRGRRRSPVQAGVSSNEYRNV